MQYMYTYFTSFYINVRNGRFGMALHYLKTRVGPFLIKRVRIPQLIYNLFKYEMNTPFHFICI